jgi:hypothetical protein
MFHCTVLSVSRNCIVCIWLLTRHRASVFASTKTFSSCVPQHCELYWCIWKSNKSDARN